MSYRGDANRVRDGSLPRGLRYRCLLSCIERYSWLTQTSFQKICLELGGRVGFRFGAENEEEALTRALDELSSAREAFLRALSVFARARSRAKAKGRRQPSKREVERLYGSVSLGADDQKS